MDDFFVELDKQSPFDVAREEICFSMPEEEASLLLKHVDLYSYGKDLMARYNSQLTEYGLVVRKDGQPIQSQERPLQEMTM